MSRPINGRNCDTDWEPEVNIVVQVSDAKVSNDAADIITTYSLGSCIGVTVYDAVAKVGGMLHYQLPTSTLDKNRATERPLMFCDTGMTALLAAVVEAGADKRRLKVKLAGGAQILDDKNMFQIGTRNHTAIRKFLWQNGLFIEGECVGGAVPRTMVLNMGTGKVEVRMRTETVEL